MDKVDGAAQRIQNQPVKKQIQNVGAAKSRPLAGKSFFLDLPSGKTLEFLEKSVKRFGGVVESFLSKEVTCIVSNNQEARKKNWGRKQIAAVLRNGTQAGTQTPVGLGKGHKDPSYKPANTGLVTRGKALLQKAIGTQNNACGGNSVLASARLWGIQIMHTDDMFAYLQWLDSKRCRSTRQMKPSPSGPQSASQVVRLQSPFLKVEDASRRLRPFLQQFKNFPELCFAEQRCRSPFDPPRSPASSKTPEGRPAHRSGSSDYCLLPKRQQGYCECCEETFVDLQMHLQSSGHRAFVLDASHYAPVDSLIAQMTSAFAVSSCSPPSPRVPPAPSGERSGSQGERIMASSVQPQKPHLSNDSPDGRSVSLGSPALLSEDPSLWRWTELLGGALKTPVLLASQSPQPPSGEASGSSPGAQPHGRGGPGADAPPKPAASPEAGPLAASPQKRAPPAPVPPQPRKRKLLFSSPGGPVKKRPTMTGQPLNLLLPDTNASPGVPPASPMEGSRSQEDGSRLSAVLAVEPHPFFAVPAQFPPEGSARPPQEHTVTEPGCLKQPGQQPEPKEGSVVPGTDAKLGTFHFQSGTRLSSQRPGSVAQPPSPSVGPSQSAEAVMPEWPDLCLPPLSGSEEPSSSESEWDRPLLCALGGTSGFPFERPIDSALLGTCVSVRDSGYESQLSSVLWQTLKPPGGFCGRPSVPSGPASTA